MHPLRVYIPKPPTLEFELIVVNLADIHISAVPITVNNEPTPQVFRGEIVCGFKFGISEIVDPGQPPAIST